MPSAEPGIPWRVSGPQVESGPQVVAGKGRRSDLRDPIEPWPVPSRCPSQEMGVRGDAFDVVSGPAEFGKFGLDCAEPGIGLVVLGVPLRPLINHQTDLLDAAFAMGDPGLGPSDVLGEAVDVVNGGGLGTSAGAEEGTVDGAPPRPSGGSP